MRMACGGGIQDDGVRRRDLRSTDAASSSGADAFLSFLGALLYLSLAPLSHLDPPFFPTGHSGGGRVFLVVACDGDRVLVACGGDGVLVACDGS
jgi:hypothetical protein